ncbi:MAG TPA: hypothetical protein VH988_11245 [Thermoanaerobaculia bacterium]|jgi:hypothetical protein|nr:hypothetical protein [Thermoanaerobaculia bacterium]
MTSPPDDLSGSQTSPEPEIDAQDEARYLAEEKRLVSLVAKLAKSRGASIRSLEAKADGATLPLITLEKTEAPSSARP